MPPTRAPSAASKQTRTARTAAWLEKTGSKTALPYDWTEKEVYLQQLVDVGLLSTAEAQAMAASHAPVAAAPEGDGGAAAAAPAPDLATVKTMLYSQHSSTPVQPPVIHLLHASVPCSCYMCTTTALQLHYNHV